MTRSSPYLKRVSDALVAENTLPSTFQRSLIFGGGRSQIVTMQGVYQLCLAGQFVRNRVSMQGVRICSSTRSGVK